VRQDATYLLEADEPQAVSIDNRDLVAWDMVRPVRKWPVAGEAPFLFQSFLAWSAAKRAGLTEQTFDAFRDQLVDVNVSEAVEEAGPTSQDPGPV